MKNSWQTKKLGEICDFQRGLTYSKKDEVGVSDNIVLRANNINLLTNTLDLADLKYISEAVEVPSNKKVQEGSLIICTASGSKSHLGKVALIDKHYDYAFGGFMGQITPNKDIVSRYLFYNLISDNYKNFIGLLADGANINNLKYDDLKKFEISLPSLPEQKRIVGILDEVFEKIEKAKENTEKNLKNSRELFESYLQEIFSNPGNDWKEKRLGDACHFVRGPFGGSLRKSIFVEDGIAVYEQQHAINDQFEKIRYFVTDEKFQEMKRFEVKPGDLIMSCSGTMGKIAIVPDKVKKGIINQALLKLSLDKIVLAKYLKYWMESRDFQNQIKLYSIGAAIKNVASVKILKEIQIPLPNISRQNEIINQLDMFFGETEMLISNYQKKLDNLDELKKSILQKAFNGEL